MPYPLLSSLLALAASAAVATPSPNQLLNSVPYDDLLAQLLVLQRHQGDYLYSPQRSSFFQDYAGALAMTGDTVGALRAFDSAFAPTTDEAIDTSQVVATPAVPAILALARSRRAIFVNEAHHVPAHRMLVRHLLAGLWQQGYRYFAGETFSEGDPDLARRGYPLGGPSGYFTREPVYAETVREAIRLGYKLVPYDYLGEPDPKDPDPMKHINTRERGETRNLYERVFAHDPHAKVVVQLGFSHLDERTGRPATWMAARFKQATGLDPLTIDQTELNEHGDPRFEHPAYAPLLARLRPSEPVLLKPREGAAWGNLGLDTGADLVVLSPRTTFRRNRPAWLYDTPGKRPVGRPHPWDEPMQIGPFPMLCQAFYHAETGDRVAADRVVVPGRGWRLPFVLGPGDYDLELRDAEGQVRSTVRHQVPG